MRPQLALRVVVTERGILTCVSNLRRYRHASPRTGGWNVFDDSPRRRGSADGQLPRSPHWLRFLDCTECGIFDLVHIDVVGFSFCERVFVRGSFIARVARSSAIRCTDSLPHERV